MTDDEYRERQRELTRLSDEMGLYDEERAEAEQPAPRHRMKFYWGDNVNGSRLWAFWRRTFIPCQDGLMYLVRLQIVRTPWFGVYMHDIYGADDDPHPHNHPWSFVSIILRGWYQEQLYPRAQIDREQFRVQTWRRFSVHRMTRDAAHRIIAAGGGCKTLIFVGPRRGTWGFFDDNGFVPWGDYEGLSKRRPHVVAAVDVDAV
jgi:hypothetical protein